MNVRETLCTRCIKRQVCKYTDSFVSTLEKIDRLGVDTENFEISLKCKHHTNSAAEFPNQIRGGL